MEVLDVPRQLRHCVSCRIAGDEHGVDDGFAILGVDPFDNLAHLVELLRTDIWAVGEAEIDEREAAEQIVMSERVRGGSSEREGPANTRTADFGRGGFGFATFFNLLLFSAEVVKKTCAGDEKQKTGFKVEGTNGEFVFC